jgi:hypothetical protein
MDLVQFVVDLAIQFWQFTLAIIIILIGAAINALDLKERNELTFNAKDMPQLKPLPMETKGKGFWGGVLAWLTGSRNWELTKDFNYTIDGVGYVIPKGFQFYCASIPKFMRTFFSPVGVMLIGGLVHDYGYKYETLLLKGKKKNIGIKDQKWMDETFRDININVNGFYTMNYLAYWTLRLGGFVAWRGHRKRNIQID